MKQWIAFLLAAALLFSLAGCASTSEQTQPPDPSGTAEVQEADATAEISGQPAIPNEPSPSPSSGGELPNELIQTPSAPPVETVQPPVGQQPSSQPQPTPEAASEAPQEVDAPNILVAYFTWADNTVVEDPAAIDVDASTSASVLAPGNAAKMASWIQAEVGGDLFSIVVTEPYSSDYDECLDRAADEKAGNVRPALSTHVANMDDYDIVFLGFPNWWYTLPMAVLSFVEKYDFSGKIVVPFVTHGTSGLASTIRDLTAALPSDVTILDPIGVYRPEVDQSRSAVQEWIAGLDLEI